MESTTLQQLKDQYAQEMGYKNFRDLQGDFAWWDDPRDVEDFMDEVANRYFEANKKPYANACCKATQENIANEFPSIAVTTGTLKSIVLDPSNIVIL